MKSKSWIVVSSNNESAWGAATHERPVNGGSQAARGEKSRELHANTLRHRLLFPVLVGISRSADQQRGNTAYSGNQRR
jgi:hypothetical protein